MTVLDEETISKADNLAQEMFLSEAGRNTDDNLYFIRDRLLEATDST
jgi:hypothetical protein